MSICTLLKDKKLSYINVNETEQIQSEIHGMSSKDDKVRDDIMRSLYAIHKGSKSINSIAKGQRELYKVIRERHQYKEKDISHHLDYLIQKGWVNQEVERKNFIKNGISREQPKNKFKISALGIEKYEEGSAFHKIKNNSSIDITSINSVIVVGERNIVNAKHSDLFQNLENLQKLISDSGDLTEEQKLNSISDITTIQNQISKTSPNKKIIELAWLGIQFIANIPGLQTVYSQVKTMILQLI